MLEGKWNRRTVEHHAERCRAHDKIKGEVDVTDVLSRPQTAMGQALIRAGWRWIYRDDDELTYVGSHAAGRGHIRLRVRVERGRVQIWGEAHGRMKRVKIEPGDYKGEWPGPADVMRLLGPEGGSDDG